MQGWSMILIALLLHAIFFFSVFEIYFTTPLVNGMQQHRSPLPAPAKRLVFIVADGLRADKIFQLRPNGESPAPFLRKTVMEKKGAWGVSHAAVPTATRPGHVALTAGFYEDPTSVAKDFQGKTVSFDTVFNESRYTWSWDTPVFLSQVTGGNRQRMYSKKYPKDMKYLAGLDAGEMDTWVFNEVKALFHESETDAALRYKMDQDSVLFFLHLGGLDHSGYIVRPNSESYLRHISLVDTGVKNMVEMFDKHYHNDGKTAYVFTSDHGMTDWGAHGDGTSEETLTPLIAWGPGFRKPEKETQEYPDGLSTAWNLEHLKRTDIRQASIAALLASIIGIPFPMNSIVPVPEELYNMTKHEVAEIMFANLRQLMAQYQITRAERKQNSIGFMFKEFSQLSPKKMEKVVSGIEQLINTEQYEEAMKELKANMHTTLNGLRYFQTYDRSYLWFGIVMSYLGWMLYLVMELAEDHRRTDSASPTPRLSWKLKAFIISGFSVLTVVIFIFLYVQSFVWTNYFYVLLPLPLWLAVCLRCEVLLHIFSLWSTIKPLLPYLLLTFIGLEFIVLGYYSRAMMSVVLLGFGVWPWIMKRDKIEKPILFQWLISCLTSAFFPLLPSATRELNYNLVVLSGILVIAVACFLVRRFNAKSLAKRKLFAILGFQIFVIAVSILVVRHTARLAATNRRTPIVNQTVSWIVLALGFIEPFLVTTDLRIRLFSIALAYISPFILFSISHEGLFMISLCWNLYVWLLMEFRLSEGNSDTTLQDELPVKMANGHAGSDTKSNNKCLESLDFAMMSQQLASGKSRQNLIRADMRRAFYFMFMVMLSLFGTGNIASVNSFDVASVYCFITVSNPLFMGTLIVLKVMIPYVLTACVLRAVNLVTRAPIKSLYILILLMCDIVGLHFFLLVRDTGSWLEVGESISHYVIFLPCSMTIMLMFGFSNILTTCNVCCFRFSKL